MVCAGSTPRAKACRTAGVRRLSLGFSLIFALTACGGSSAQEPVSAPAQPAVESSAPPHASAGTKPATVEEAAAFMADVEDNLRRLSITGARAAWINMNFITDDTDALSAAAEEANMAYVGRAIQEAGRFDGLTLPEELDRKFHLLRISQVLPAPADSKERAELAGLSVSMSSMYGKGKYCPPRLKGKCLSLQELEGIIKKSRKFDDLTDAWVGWHDLFASMKPSYQRFVELGNKGSREIGFKDMGALWRSGYDMSPEDFEAETERLWQEVKPLYDKLHCYVRAQLHKTYPQVSEQGPIPANVLGNMWAQEWTNIYPLVEPYKGQPSIDVTRALVAKKYDEKGMVKVGERFFTGLGLPALPQTFWERSLFKKPADRDVVCHASAWDLDLEGDIRIKMCVQINEEDLVTVHHELGHNYYYLAYNPLSVLFQQGANDGFHEGIGDTLALSVTPGYLKSLGLVDKVANNDKARVNFLMKQALDKVAFLPFGKLIDQWRWDVFSGKTTPERYNDAWWELRRKYQGVDAPAPRSPGAFDPGGKYHVPANTPYTRYFLARIYQFQFHRALCDAAGQKGPLDQCSIAGSKEAGKKLWAMLQLGASEPWPEAMRAITGQDKADASALLEYFAPLSKWLDEQNQGKTCGW